MFTATDIVWSIVIPALIGIVIGIGCWRPWRRGRAKAWAGPLGMGVGFFVAFPVIQYGEPWRCPAMVPREASEWLAWIAALATVVGLFSLVIRAPRWGWAIVVLAVSAAGCGWMLRFEFSNGWSPLRGGWIFLGFAVAAAVWWAILEAFGEEDPISTAVVQWLIGCCAAVVLMLTGSLTYGKLPLPLAAVAGAVCVLGIWRREKVRINGMAMVFSIVMMGILAGGTFLSDLKVPLLVLILCAPVVAGLSMLLPMRMRFWRRIVLRIILAAIPLGAAVAVAAVEFAHQQQESNFSND